MGSLNWEKIKPYLPYVLAVGVVALLAYFTRKGGSGGGGTSYRLASGGGALPAASPSGQAVAGGASGVRTLAPSSAGIEPIAAQRYVLAPASFNSPFTSPLVPANSGAAQSASQRAASLYDAQSQYQIAAAANREATLREQARLSTLMQLGSTLTNLLRSQQQQRQQQQQPQTRPQTSTGGSSPAQPVARNATTQTALERLRRVLAGYRDSVYARNAAAPADYSEFSPADFGGLNYSGSDEYQFDQRYFDWLDQPYEPVGYVSSDFSAGGFWGGDGNYYFGDGSYYDAIDDIFYEA